MLSLVDSLQAAACTRDAAEMFIEPAAAISRNDPQEFGQDGVLGVPWRTDVDAETLVDPFFSSDGMNF